MSNLFNLFQGDNADAAATPKVLPCDELLLPHLDAATRWSRSSGIPVVPQKIVSKWLTGASLEESVQGHVQFASSTDSQRSADVRLRRILPVLHSVLQEKVPSALAAIVTVATQRHLTSDRFEQIEGDADMVEGKHIRDFAAYLLKDEGGIEDRLRRLRLQLQNAYQSFFDAVQCHQYTEESQCEDDGQTLSGYLPAIDVLLGDVSSDIYRVLHQHTQLSQVTAVTSAAYRALYEWSSIVASESELVIPYEQEGIISGPRIARSLRPYALSKLLSQWIGAFPEDLLGCLLEKQLDSSKRKNFIKHIAIVFCQSWSRGSSLIDFVREVFAVSKNDQNSLASVCNRLGKGGDNYA